MITRADILVIGGGAMGSAAAWQLASRGREVTLIERFWPGHTNGASHGASRNFNLSYSDATYLALLTESLPLWRTLERESGTALLDQVGVANHGANPAFDAVAEALAHSGFDAEFLPVAEAQNRWPGIRFDRRVLVTPQAGRLDADSAVSALQSVAAARGATVRHRSRVTGIRVAGDDSVLVEVQPTDTAGADAGERQTYDARRVVVTLGAWTTKLLGNVAPLPRLLVTQEQPMHFSVRDESLSWPGFNHSAESSDREYDYWYSNVYGMFTPGQGVKAGWHGVGPVVDPDARSFLPEPRQSAALRRYAREWLPGVDPDRFAEISCTYTTTADSNFVVDRIGPVMIGAGFSGHGFKFTPAIGRILADLATGRGGAPELFSLTASRTSA